MAPLTQTRPPGNCSKSAFCASAAFPLPTTIPPVRLAVFGMGIWHSESLPAMSRSATSRTTPSQEAATVHQTREDASIIRRRLSPIHRRRWLCRDQLAGPITGRLWLILELTNRPSLPLPCKKPKVTILNRQSLNLRSRAALPTAAPKISSALPISTAAHPATHSEIRKTSSAVQIFSSAARKTPAALPISPALGTKSPAAFRMILGDHPDFPSASRIFPSAASTLSAIT